MKRSEVIKIIQGLYEIEMDNFPKHNPSDLFAENLLVNLEEMGMLPPPVVKKVNEWEDSDD